MGCFGGLWKDYMGKVIEVMQACAYWENKHLKNFDKS
jgi:hypothetical protein